MRQTIPKHQALKGNGKHNHNHIGAPHCSSLVQSPKYSKIDVYES